MNLPEEFDGESGHLSEGNPGSLDALWLGLGLLGEQFLMGVKQKRSCSSVSLSLLMYIYRERSLKLMSSVIFVHGRAA